MKVTTQSDRTRTILEIAGKLAGPWVQELEACWQRVVAADQPVKVILNAVTFIDNAGRELLTEMHRHGAELVAEGCMTKAIIDKIIQGHTHEPVCRRSER